jgi:hypothetical protein
MDLSVFLNLVLEKTERITRRKFWPVILGAFFMIIVIINGISLVPFHLYQRISQNPFVIRTDMPSNNYWQEDILLPLIAFFTHLNNPLTFSILCFVIIIGAYLLYTMLVLKKSGPFPALIFSTILISSPLTTILLSWLGTPDGLTFLLTIPFLFTNSFILIFLLTLLGTINHLTFIIAVIEILFLRLISRDNIRIIHLIAIILGGIAGYIVLKIFLASNNIQVMSRLDFIFNINLNTWLKHNLADLPMTVFSFFNIQWLIIPICLLMFFNKDKRYYSFMLAILLLNYGITFFSLDTTRIFSLLSWGIFANCILHSFNLAKKENETNQKEFLQALIVVGVISFIAPRYYSWEGSIHTSPFYSFIEKVLGSIVK